MKVLFVIKSLVFAGGGAERVIGVIASELARRGHEITILTFDAVDTQDFYGLADEVKRIRLGLGQVGKRSRLAITVRRLIGIRTEAMRLRPDVTVAFMHSAFIPSRLALLGTGIPLVGSERTSYDHYSRRPLQRTLLRATAPFLTTLTVNGKEVREGFPRAIASRMVVMPNPVACGHTRADPIGADLKTLLCIGMLRPEKDHITLLNSFSRVAGQFPDWRLRIVGDGPLRSSLVERAEALGLADRVEFAGSTPTVEREYAKAQLFVLPSIYEAFPNCLAEALAAGLPAVGFADCRGTNALIIPGVNGELAEGPDRAAALSQTLAQLMSSPSIRAAQGRAAPSTVADYSLTKIAGQWERLLLRATRSTVTSEMSF